VETGSLAKRIVEGARDAASEVVDEASELGAAAARLLTAAAKMRPGEGRAARRRRIGRSNRVPLPNLFDLHPDARLSPRRELGLLTIPVSEIRGTAVEGPAQRGSDFLPLPALKSDNWRNRWQRIRAAQDRLEILPPIDVIQTSDGYWVTDGHNRVGAALYGGQDDIDASVTHLHLRDTDDAHVRTGNLGTILEDSRQLRAAGEGRLDRGGTARERPRPPGSVADGPGSATNPPESADNAPEADETPDR
jgi:hypothetical protein